MLNFCPGHLLADTVVTCDTEIRHLFFEDRSDRGTMGVVAHGTGFVFYRRMYNRGFLQRLGKISMAGKTSLPHRPLEKRLFRGFVGIMTFGTGTNGNGTVHELLLDQSAVMTSHTEFRLVLADVQQKPSSRAVRLVAGNTVTFLDRCMDNFFLAEGAMALIT